MSSPTECIAEPDAIALDLEAGSGEAAVRRLHAELVRGAADGIVDAQAFLADVLARMQVASVCIAPDVALPHARTPAVSRLVLAIGRTRTPVAFDAGHPGVRLILLVGTPRNAVTEYLQVVAAWSRIMRNPTARAALDAAETEAEIRALLSGSAAGHR